MGSWSKTMETRRLSEIITMLGDIPVHFCTEEEPFGAPIVYSLLLSGEDGKKFDRKRQEEIDMERRNHYRRQSFFLRLKWALFPGDRKNP